jgi:citrate lyase beta subunit
MPATLPPAALAQALARLRGAARPELAAHPAESGERQAVHTVYGGAHLFRADVAHRLGQAARRALEDYAPDAGSFAAAIGLDGALAEAVHARVLEKLAREPVEDFRVDFEDGYGNRPDAEEDAHAEAAAAECAAGLERRILPPFFGIRVKPFSPELLPRSARTLDLFLTRLAGAGSAGLPPGFVVTLPKVVAPAQVSALADLLDALEPALGLAPGSVRIELMIETPTAILAEDGAAAAPRLVAAARGRCGSAHFGTYDYTASLEITAAHQRMDHPVCDFAKHVLQVALAGTGVRLSDGATNVLPVAPHRAGPDGRAPSAAQLEENRRTVHAAWRLHADHVRHSLRGGYYQGWDLHPAQLPTRYAAVYGFFLEGLDAAAGRLANFVGKSAQATLAGDVMDDAATGQGLLNYFLRAVNCGAISEDEATRRTGLAAEELRGRSFLRILERRRAGR